MSLLEGKARSRTCSSIDTTAFRLSGGVVRLFLRASKDRLALSMEPYAATVMPGLARLSGCRQSNEDSFHHGPLT